MRTFVRWWETLGRPERIVAMSLATGGVVAIANSTTWAIAVCYMTRQKALVAMAARHAGAPGDSTPAGLDASGEYGRMSFEDSPAMPATGRGA